MKSSKKISVILPVFNDEAFLSDAIKSILGQTFKDFELLLLLDGCTDNSPAIASSFKDKRIKLVINKINKGFVYRLNQGIKMATAEYISIMNADDVALPQKLEKQIHFLEANKEIGLCGTWVERIGSKQDIVKHNTDHENILVDLLYGNPFSHPSIIFKKSLITNTKNYYDSEYGTVEDMDLWQRLILHTRAANLPESLLKYRVHPMQMSETQAQIQRTRSNILKQRFFETLFFKLDEASLFCWNKLFNYEYFEFSETNQLFDFIHRIKNTPVSFPSAFMYELTYRLEQVIYHKFKLFEIDQRTIFHKNNELVTQNKSLEDNINQLRDSNTTLELNNQHLLENVKISSAYNAQTETIIPRFNELQEIFSTKIEQQKISLETFIAKNIEEEDNRLTDFFSHLQKQVLNTSELILSELNEHKNDHSIKQSISETGKKQELLVEQLTTLKEIMNNLKMEASQTNHTNQIIVSEIFSGYKKEIETLQNQYRNLNGELLVQKENTMRATELATLNNKFFDLYNEYIKTKNDFFDIDRKLNEQVQENEKLKQQLEQAHLHNEKLQNKISSQQIHLDKQEEEHKHLSRLIAAKENEVIHFQLLNETNQLEISRLNELLDTQHMELLLAQQNFEVDSSVIATHTNVEAKSPMTNEAFDEVNELYKKSQEIIQEKDTQLERLQVKNNIYQNYQEQFIIQKTNLEQRIKLLEDLVQQMRIKERLKRIFLLKGY